MNKGAAPVGLRREIYRQELRPGQGAGYRALHRAVWPELEAVYREAGYTDLACFIHNDTVLILVAYDPERLAARKDWLEAHPVERRWQALMAAYKSPDAGGAATFEEIYRLPDGDGA